MTIARRLSKSWTSPKFDIKDPNLSLYLPLWYPYSDMAGSSIYSYDKNRHICTVNSPTWGSAGRTFNGTSDYITIPHAASLTVTSEDFTIRTWIKINNMGAGSHRIFCKGVEDTSGYLFYYHANGSFGILTCQASASQISNANAGSLTTDIWYQLTATRSGAVCKVYLNGDGVTAVSGNHTNPANNTDVAVIGADQSLDSRFVNAIVGELVFDKNKASADVEVMKYYQTTKWRFQ